MWRRQAAGEDDNGVIVLPWRRGIFSCKQEGESCRGVPKCCGDLTCYWENGYSARTVGQRKNVQDNRMFNSGSWNAHWHFVFGPCVYSEHIVGDYRLRVCVCVRVGGCVCGVRGGRSDVSA